jgi:predicted NAD-dependent protein-ADP-ribosyltransferase YbiA (DUF1768 family)
MHAVSSSRAEKFKKLWGLSAAPSEASEAWGQLRTLNMKHGHPILSHEFPQKASQYLLARCLRTLGRAWVPKNTAFDAVLEWLRKYAVLIFPDWAADMSNGEIPERFHRVLKEFFLNLRSIYAEGRVRATIPHDFWPWFVGVLEVAVPKGSDVASVSSSSSAHDASTFPVGFAGVTHTFPVSAFKLTHAHHTHPAPSLAIVHKASQSPETRKVNLKEIKAFSTIDDFKRALLAGNDVNASNILDVAVKNLGNDFLPSVNMALLHYGEIRKTSIEFLRPHRHTSVSYSRKQCSGILFGMIMGSYSDLRGSHGHRIWIHDILHGARNTDASAAKLSCFFAYWVSFHQLNTTNPAGFQTMMAQTVTFEIKSTHQHTDVMELLTSHKDLPIIPVDFRRGEDMSDDAQGNLFVDFANKDIGGGVLSNGSVQEEIEFSRRPECLVSILISPTMTNDDVIFLSNTVTTSKTKGYADKFRFEHALKPDQMVQQTHKNHDIVAMDATSFKSHPLSSDDALRKRYLSLDHVKRDFLKCYIAFLGPQSLSAKPLRIVTGAWGTGDFSGTSNKVLKNELRKIKQAIQVAAATIAYKDRKTSGNSLTYYDDKRIDDNHNTVKSILQHILRINIDSIPAAASSASSPQPSGPHIGHRIPFKINGIDSPIIAFYYPDSFTDIDVICRKPMFGNFWEAHIDIFIRTQKYKFLNAEAAFQALKFTQNNIHFFQQIPGKTAYRTKAALEKTPGAKDPTYSGLDNNWNAMYLVLQAKFQNPHLKTILLNTGTCFLLEHTEVTGRDHVWSDNHNGEGMNWLGLQLMMLREAMGGRPTDASIKTIMSTYSARIQAMIRLSKNKDQTWWNNKGDFDFLKDDPWQTIVRDANRAVLQNIQTYNRSKLDICKNLLDNAQPRAALDIKCVLK